MYEDKENCFYYITTMNENYVHPEMPVAAEEGIIKGMYLLKEGKQSNGPRVQLMGAGTILREVEAAAVMLREDYGVESDVWSLTSVNELARDGQACERWNLINSEAVQKVPYITQCLSEQDGPVILSTDYIKTYGEQLRAYVPGDFKVLGTDGFGRSDTRKKLRHFFEVDRSFVVLAALTSLAKQGKFDTAELPKVRQKLGIDANKADPTTV
jgi:pyruvate dehydrogenase E1 component